METVNIKDVPLDIRQQKFVSVGEFYQNDTNIIKFTLSDNNNPADLSNVDEILINYKRPDGEIISRLLEAESNIINYQLGQSEMQTVGLGKLVLQFFSNDKRLSTFIVNVSVKKSIEVNFEFEEAENPLVDQLFERINTLINRIEILESIINNGTPPITNTSPNITSTFNLTSINDSTSIAIPYVISDAQGGNMSATYTKNGVVTTANVNVGSNTWNVGTLAVGNHVLKIKVTDAGGLTSNELTFNLVVIQTEVPTTNTAPIITSSFNLTTTTTETDISIPYSVVDSEGGAITATLTKNGVNTSQTIPAGANVWDVGRLSEGTNVLSIQVKDSGNLISNVLTFNIIVTALVEPPSILSTFNTVSIYDNTSLVIPYSVTNQGSGSLTATYTVDGATKNSKVFAGDNFWYIGRLSAGNHSLSLKVTNSSDLTSNIFNFSIVVTETPVASESIYTWVGGVY